jgi:hypothetical protein
MDAVPKRIFREHYSLGDFIADLEAGRPRPEETGPDYWAMTGTLRPINYSHGDPEEQWEGIIIECELAKPKSMEGRNVSVWIRGEEVDWLFKVLRDVLVERRSRPMSEVAP